MTTLAQYERARTALAEATRVDEILPLRAEVEHLKLYARQIKDQELLAEAHVFQARVERKLGVVIDAAKAAGHITQGRRKKDDGKTSDEEVFRVNLADVGIDHKLSARAQKAASISEQAFEMTVEAMRERIVSGKAKIVGGEVVKGARAIMGSRVEPDDSLDYFPTPPWATRALLADVFPALGVGNSRRQSAWEPACGEGHIAEVLREHFRLVRATDIHDYGYGDIGDFLGMDAGDADWIITNPPFGEKTEAFVLRALDLARVGVAMFVRMQWLETIGRYERLFRDRPPTLISFFCERVNLCKGRWDPDGTTATAYIWLVWMRDTPPRAPFWIPPGRREALSHDDDVARFTARPVLAKDHPADADGTPLEHDDETGEILDEPTGGEGPALAATPPVDLNAPRPLDIPAFLRRRAPEAVRS